MINKDKLKAKITENEALWDDKHVKTEKSVDQRLDDGSTNIDNIDATEYSFEPYISGLMRLRN